MLLPSRAVAAAAAAAILVATPTTTNAHLADHRYKTNEHVELWVNMVGPYANPAEAYEYYSLPYCAPDTKHHPNHASIDLIGRFNEWKSQNIGEYLGGHSLRHSGHDITFDPETTPQKMESCTTQKLTEKQVETFNKAVQKNWFYQMYLDDLPVWGMVGEMLPKVKAASDVVKQFQQAEEEEGLDDLKRLDMIMDREIENGLDMNEGGGSALQPQIYTTRNLVISYNKDQIVKVDLTSETSSLVTLKAGMEIDFTLQVTWEPTEEHFNSRFDRYLDHDFFKHPIHWFSVFNSFMMVLFLMGLVALILLRTLRKDYARYGIVYDLDAEVGEGSGADGDTDRLVGGAEDSGWKQVHGDVFRAPQYLPLLAALLGSGWQLIVLTSGVIFNAVLGRFHGAVHEERGEIWQSVLVCYILSSIVSGYMSGKYFKLYYPTTQEARKNSGTVKTASSGNSDGANTGILIWQKTMGLTILLVPVFCTCVLTVLNSISMSYGTINTIPFMVILKLFSMWMFLSVPLNVFGTLVGRHTKPASKANDDFPCRVNAIPRSIPEDNVQWYGKPIVLIMLPGMLSFGSIFIELYYLLTSLWNYKIYHVYEFLFGVFCITTIVVSMTSIICVYFLLNSENYHWQWTSFGSGASISIYFFLYTIYYYKFKTQMTGFLQFSSYFGNNFLAGIILASLCGTIGHAAASKFVRLIFANVKID